MSKRNATLLYCKSPFCESYCVVMSKVTEIITTLFIFHSTQPFLHIQFCAVCACMNWKKTGVLGTYPEPCTHDRPLRAGLCNRFTTIEYTSDDLDPEHWYLPINATLCFFYLLFNPRGYRAPVILTHCF